jgi:hypothetical protein
LLHSEKNACRVSSFPFPNQTTSCFSKADTKKQSDKKDKPADKKDKAAAKSPDAEDLELPIDWPIPEDVIAICGEEISRMQRKAKNPRSILRKTATDVDAVTAVTQQAQE